MSRQMPRRTRLVSDPNTDQHWSPAPVGSLKEECEPPKPPTLTSRELISLLDTAVVFRVRPQEGSWRHSNLLIDTLTEDIARQVTLPTPVIASTPIRPPITHSPNGVRVDAARLLPRSQAEEAEKEDQVDQRKDITDTARGGGIAGFANMMYSGLRYVINIAMTHMVSPNIYGVFGEVIAAVSLLGVMANVGFDEILLFLLPAYRVKNEKGLASGLARFSIWISLIAGCLLGALLFIFAPMIAQNFYHAPSDELMLRELAFLIPLIALVGVFTAGIQALKEIAWKVYLQVSLPLITLIALVIFYVLGWGTEALVFSAIGGYICSVLMGRIVFRKFMKRFTGNSPARYMPRQWFGFALPSLFSVQIFNVAITADILILSVFVTPAQASIYIAASRLSGLVNMPMAALNVIFIPLMAEYYAKGKREQLESMFKLVTKWTFSLSLPVCLCCLVFHDVILGIFGAQYTAGWLVLVILCFGYLANTGTGAVFQLLLITRRLRVVSIDSVTQLILIVGLCFLLVPRFNILGAALAAALTLILLSGLCVIEVYWIMKLHPYRWDMCKPLLAGGVATLVGILLLHFVQLHAAPGRFAVLAELGLIVLFFVVYILVLLLLRFSEEDRIVFNALLVKFGRQRPTRGARSLQKK